MPVKLKCCWCGKSSRTIRDGDFMVYTDHVLVRFHGKLQHPVCMPHNRQRPDFAWVNYMTVWPLGLQWKD